MDTPSQLALDLPYTAPSHDILRAASNEAALTWLARGGDWPQGRLALWGEPGCGKTHLLTDWATRTGATLLQGGALPDLGTLGLGTLGLGTLDVAHAKGFAIDDAEHLTDEAALFHLLNAAAEAGLPVLLAARTPPARWPVRLPDLASRLRAITAVAIDPPEDALLRSLLPRLLEQHGQRVPEPVLEWLLTRLPRAPGVLREVVDRLDRAALARPGGITLPFAREMLGDLLNAAGADPDTGGTTNLDEDSMSSAPGSPSRAGLL